MRLAQKQTYAAALEDVAQVLGVRKTMLSIGEYAQLTGRHYQTVWRLVSRGELPAVQQGKFGRYRISYRQLVDFEGGSGA